MRETRTAGGTGNAFSQNNRIIYSLSATLIKERQGWLQRQRILEQPFEFCLRAKCLKLQRVMEPFEHIIKLWTHFPEKWSHTWNFEYDFGEEVEGPSGVSLGPKSISSVLNKAPVTSHLGSFGSVPLIASWGFRQGTGGSWGWPQSQWICDQSRSTQRDRHEWVGRTIL